VSGAPSAQEVSNSWYGMLTEGTYQNTPDEFRVFMEREVLSLVSTEDRSKLLGELVRWIPDQEATIRGLGQPSENETIGSRVKHQAQLSALREPTAALRTEEGVHFALFDGGRPGLVSGEAVRDLTEVTGNRLVEEPGDAMLHLIQHWDHMRLTLDDATISNLPELSIHDVRLDPPIPRPGKIVAAPVNYVNHKEEMNVKATVAQLGVFLKASSSVIGPGGTIELPYTDRRTDQEGELAVVIGKTTRNVLVADALDHVFGYTCLLDITVRGQEDRSTRKSFDTFTPIGPWITSNESVGDPGQLDLKCWVNEELRQDANTRDLIYGVPKLIEYISSVMTLYPGDIVSTGTPSGVGPIADGDRVAVEIERVGRLEVGVSDKNATESPKQG
jgi:2-keto-4-pentenoate hydratase/2-oxohepta-3-ene-1,7-dioic acid hydratase in catechol pathway